VGIEILGLLVAGAGASWGWWMLQRARNTRLGLKELESAFEPDAQIVFTVAGHAMTTRGHTEMWPLHLLYGLLQDESFTSAVKAQGGDPDAIESKVLTELDDRKTDERGPEQLVYVINHAYYVARSHDRKVSVVDLAGRVLGVPSVSELLGIDPYELNFRLVHGLAPPSLEMPGRTDVAVVLRNDNFTTFEFVIAVLVNVFDLPPDDAEARAMQTHKESRSIIGRYKLAVARDKLITARARARDAGFPLWIGLEDC
jgi:ATP-dependent Clp protease adaptor protein ClpS